MNYSNNLPSLQAHSNDVQMEQRQYPRSTGTSPASSSYATHESQSAYTHSPPPNPAFQHSQRGHGQYPPYNNSYYSGTGSSGSGGDPSASLSARSFDSSSNSSRNNLTSSIPAASFRPLNSVAAMPVLAAPETVPGTATGQLAGYPGASRGSGSDYEGSTSMYSHPGYGNSDRPPGGSSYHIHKLPGMELMAGSSQQHAATTYYEPMSDQKRSLLEAIGPIAAPQNLDSSSSSKIYAKRPAGNYGTTGRPRLSRATDPATRRQHELDLKRAMTLVVLNNNSLRQAAASTGVSHETLRRRLRNLRQKNEDKVRREAPVAQHPVSVASDKLRVPVLHREASDTASYSMSQASSLSSARRDESLSPGSDEPSSGRENEGEYTVRGSSNSSLKNLSIDNKHMNRLKSELEGFERTLRRELYAKTPALYALLTKEFEKVKSGIHSYSAHASESMEMAKMMILEDIKQYERGPPHHQRSGLDLSVSAPASPYASAKADYVAPVSSLGGAWDACEAGGHRHSSSTHASPYGGGANDMDSVQKVRRVTSISNITNSSDYPHDY